MVQRTPRGSIPPPRLAEAQNRESKRTSRFLNAEGVRGQPPMPVAGAVRQVQPPAEAFGSADGLAAEGELDLFQRAAADVGQFAVKCAAGRGAGRARPSPWRTAPRARNTAGRSPQGQNRAALSGGGQREDQDQDYSGRHGFWNALITKPLYPPMFHVT